LTVSGLHSVISQKIDSSNLRQTGTALYLALKIEKKKVTFDSGKYESKSK
jgi:hypothetical protein